VTGKARKVTITLDDVARQAVTFATVSFALEGIAIDRATIVQGNPRITDIDRGTITATIDLGSVGGVLGRIADAVGLRPQMSGRTLHIGSAAVPISSDLFPCSPEAAIEDRTITLSCTIDEVPEALIEAAQR
jgi:hypothetical protein